MAEEKSLRSRHVDDQLSKMRRNQLHASDVLLHHLKPDATIDREDSRPFLPGFDQRISISHTGLNLALILGDHPVAIDMEPRSRSVAKIQHKFQNAKDLDVANKGFSENPSLLIWCIKECLFKVAHTSGVDFKDHLHLLRMTDEQAVECQIDHPDMKTYLRVDYRIYNNLLIATIG